MPYFCFCIIAAVISYIISYYCKNKTYNYHIDNANIWNNLNILFLALTIIFITLIIFPIFIIFIITLLAISI